MTITQWIFSVMLVYLPAMVANMAPVVAAKWNLFPRLNRAMDFGYTFRGERLLGSHKTIRGVFVACIAGAITGAIEALVQHRDVLHGCFVGGVIGFGAIAGDAVKSFFKRRFHVASGSLWIPFDQIDFVIGATLFGMMVENISLASALVAIIFIGCLSYVVSAIAFALHIKKNL